MSSMPRDSVKRFFDTYPAVKYGKGEILLRPDEKLEDVFYIVEGQIVEYDISPAGNEVVVNVFKPGAFFPMSIAINKNRNEYFFETATAVTARPAPADEVVDFIKDNPDVGFDLLSRVYRGTDGLIRRMAHLMGGKSKSRLVYELLNAAARFGEYTSDGQVRIPLSEKDIAKRSGLSRETVSRTMHGLKQLELVIVKPGSIFVPDVKKLEDVIGNEL